MEKAGRAMAINFDHEKLRVYQEAIAFIAWCDELLERSPGRAAVRDHLDRAATSIPLNIAEGNGKRAGKDRRRFLEIARGSALECAACLDVLAVKTRVDASCVDEGKVYLKNIVSMLTGLIGVMSNQVKEEPESYEVDMKRAEQRMGKEGEGE